MPDESLLPIPVDGHHAVRGRNPDAAEKVLRGTGGRPHGTPVRLLQLRKLVQERIPVPHAAAAGDPKDPLMVLEKDAGVHALGQHRTRLALPRNGVHRHQADGNRHHQRAVIDESQVAQVRGTVLEERDNLSGGRIEPLHDALILADVNLPVLPRPKRHDRVREQAVGRGITRLDAPAGRIHADDAVAPGAHPHVPRPVQDQAADDVRRMRHEAELPVVAVRPPQARTVGADVHRIGRLAEGEDVIGPGDMEMQQRLRPGRIRRKAELADAHPHDVVLVDIEGRYPVTGQGEALVRVVADLADGAVVADTENAQVAGRHPDIAGRILRDVHDAGRSPGNGGQVDLLPAAVHRPVDHPAVHARRDPQAIGFIHKKLQGVRPVHIAAEILRHLDGLHQARLEVRPAQEAVSIHEIEATAAVGAGMRVGRRDGEGHHPLLRGTVNGKDAVLGHPEIAVVGAAAEKRGGRCADAHRPQSLFRGEEAVLLVGIAGDALRGVEPDLALGILGEARHVQARQAVLFGIRIETVCVITVQARAGTHPQDTLRVPIDRVDLVAGEAVGRGVMAEGDDIVGPRRDQEKKEKG